MMRSGANRNLPFGWGYTGESDGWIQETIDLSSYAGEIVMVVSGLTPITTEWAYYKYQASLD
ncbi:MAG: hypothetical protein JXB07_09340 [Anaerolineae bacterium]|nr:hypothetical protein [Anaerolineae bacterium]